MDTIVAISTPVGESAIAVIRLSGDRAADCMFGLLFNDRGEKVLKKEAGRMSVAYCRAGKVKDKVMYTWFESPKTYTGEQTAELYCHGSKAVTDAVLRALLQAGCRQAEAGEFTRRAFLNGKIDLTAAEGIADLIAAQTDAQAETAFSHTEGKLYKKIEKLFTDLNELAASIEACIDYPEEDVEEISREKVRALLSDYEKQLKQLTDGYSDARLIREGVRVALTGAVNVGKSSILNAILKENRAIVTPIAGTTRDIIEESYSYKGVKFVLCDTAGLRDTQDCAEQEGIQRALQAIRRADIVAYVFEAGQDYKPPTGTNVVCIKNKCDLKMFDSHTADLEVSARTGEGIENLKELLYQKAGLKNRTDESVFNLRQYEAAVRANDIICALLEKSDKLTMDVMMSEIEQAANELGKITGRTASKEMIDSIFRRFCVGK